MTAALALAALLGAAGGAARAAGPAIPDVPALTHLGEPVRFYQDLVRDRLVLIGFTYTACRGSCPRAAAALAQVQALLGPRLGTEVSIVSVTLDPARDTPETLRRHAAAVGARPGWTFVTGAAADMERLRRALGFTDPDPVADADRAQHASLVLVGDDRTGRWTAVPAAAGAAGIVAVLRRVERERAARAPGPRG